jgi:hypothetical protein
MMVGSHNLRINGFFPCSHKKPKCIFHQSYDDNKVMKNDWNPWYRNIHFSLKCATIFECVCYQRWELYLGVVAWELSKEL